MNLIPLKLLSPPRGILTLIADLEFADECRQPLRVTLASKRGKYPSPMARSA
jgi:hypothetical protein